MLFGKSLDYSVVCDSQKCLLYAVDATKIIQRFENDKGSKKHLQALANAKLSQQVHNTKISSTQSLYESYSSVLAERRLMSNPFSKPSGEFGQPDSAEVFTRGHSSNEQRDSVTIPGM